MGAIQSACPVRKTPGAQPKLQQKAGETDVSQMRTRSTKQFEGGSLSKTAECFNPPGLQPPSPSKVPTSRITAKLQARQKAAAMASEPQGVNKFDPEWAQYLQKKATEREGPAVQKFNSRGATDPPKTGGTAAPGFTLQTSEYLKLLKDLQPSKGAEKKLVNQGGDKLFSKDTSITALKTDLAAALDSIIKTQQGKTSGGRKNPKADALLKRDNAGENGGAEMLWRLVQMDNKGDKQEIGKEVEDPIRVQDDIFCEQHNRDEDLAVPCYWSDDDQGPKAVKRASAHHAVGKVPGVRPRPYVTQKLNDYLDHKVAILLLHLRKFGSRQRTIEPDQSAKRRLIVGLKEVARSVRNGKVKCVVIAPDIVEAYQTGSQVDERVREIICACYKQDTPVIFALSRTRIGRALGKSLRMSALAILDVTGVQDLYGDILEKSYAQRVEWLAEQPKPQKPEAPWKAKAAAKSANKQGAKA